MTKPAKDTTTIAEKMDLHELYQEAVQAPETEVEFFDTTYEKLRGKKAMSMKEDFCGTAYLSVEWCKSDAQRTAVGVDFCKDTLAWGVEHNVEPNKEILGDRLTLIEADVREVTEPKVDITCAFNFSFCIFKTRDELRGYFEKAREGLKDDGMFILDLFGGTECQDELEEETELDDIDATYIWEHEKFNPISNEITCHIHFEFPDGSRLEKAFTYNWRLWSIPEIQELLEEAGFSKVHVFWEEFEDDEDDEDLLEGTGDFYETTEVENQESWQIYIVADK